MNINKMYVYLFIRLTARRSEDHMVSKSVHYMLKNTQKQHGTYEYAK